MHMLGGPPQMDLLDYKPALADWYDKDLPDSIRRGQRLTTMSSGQTRFPIAPSIYKFSQHGQSGAWVSSSAPYTAKIVDDIAIVKSLYTEQINHEPAITYIQTGSMTGGRPCIGSWLAYGLGNMTEDLPTFVVMNAVRSNLRTPFRRCRPECGARDSCRRSTLACRSAQEPNRCCSSTIPTASLLPSGGGCWMAERAE
jgi:hypothetical protein